MKKILIILLAVSILAVAGIALAGINTTPHNIPQQYAGKANTEPCAFCHTPHVAGSPLVYPLWNRTQTSQNYTMYTSATFNMWPGDTRTSEQVDSSTRACMQCHNGVASTLINYPGRGRNTASGDASKYNMAAGDLSNFGNLGTSLQEEHPVGFVYDPVGDPDGEGNNFPTSLTSNKIGGYLPLYTVNGSFTGAAPSSSSMMGCGTCHEPHNRFSYSGSGNTQVYFLRNAAGSKGNADSDLCRTCHVNKY